ncbi:MAG TPA: hypothetical protein VIZ43_20955 [Trebonia sp.]
MRTESVGQDIAGAIFASIVTGAVRRSAAGGWAVLLAALAALALAAGVSAALAVGRIDHGTAADLGGASVIASARR